MDNEIDVFISYSHEDKSLADIVCSELTRDEIKCWYAPRDIKAGESWAGSIIKAISSAKILVLIFTSRSNESTQVRREIERATSKNIKVVPFRVENKDFSADLEYFISSCQWVDAFTRPVEEHVKELLEEIRKILPPKERLSYTKGSTYRWLEITDEGYLGESVEVACRSCGFKKHYDPIFNDRPPEYCPACGFDGKKKTNAQWYVIQPGGMGDRDIRCKKCRDIIVVSHYESDYKIPESCPTCHFGG